MSARIVPTFLAAFLSLCCCAHLRAELSARELLLIFNSSVPESVDVANYYAQKRGVPADHLLGLDLPAGEDISPADYDAKIVAPVREFLRTPAGRGVRCIVLCYGVPLHVSSRPTTEADRAEVARLQRMLATLDKRTPQIAQDVEEMARTLGLNVPAIPGKGTQAARVRCEVTGKLIQEHLAKLAASGGDKGLIQRFEARRAQIFSDMVRVGRDVIEEGGNEAEPSTTEPAAATPASAPAVKPATTQATTAASTTSPATTRPTTQLTPLTPSERTHAQALANQPRDAAARAELRKIISNTGGAFAVYFLLEQQVTWVSGDESDASVDSELALVRIADFPRFRWQTNPLYWRQHDPASPVIMTARVDGPTPQIAKRLVDDAIAVEKNGLTGIAVFDSRQIAAPKTNSLDGYGWYDQAIRDAAKFVADMSTVKVQTDDRPQVLMPDGARDVALYCGWYSLRNYVNSCRFNQGAVGYHVASLELVRLRDPNERGWVANMLKEGVAGTLGAVSEPYLHSFPRPEEFFPLLMTGKLTLAETYWLTNPLTSWKIAMIGDPLYRPYAAKPALKIEALSPGMRAALQKIEAARPSDR